MCTHRITIFPESEDETVLAPAEHRDPTVSGLPSEHRQRKFARQTFVVGHPLLIYTDLPKSHNELFSGRDPKHHVHLNDQTERADPRSPSELLANEQAVPTSYIQVTSSGHQVTVLALRRRFKLRVNEVRSDQMPIRSDQRSLLGGKVLWLRSHKL